MTGFESDPGDEQPELTLTVPESSNRLRRWDMAPGTLIDLNGGVYEVVHWPDATTVSVRKFDTRGWLWVS